MTDKPNLNDRILSRKAGDDDPDTFEDCGSFGFLRGVKDRAAMLDLRLKTGNREIFPYSLLERISYDPSEGITLTFMGTTVKLIGERLGEVLTSGVSLVDALSRQRVPWIAEGDVLRRSGMEGTLVTGICILKPRN